MAIAIDTQKSGQAGGAGPNTFSFTTTGSDIVLVLACLSNGTTTPTATYNGVSFTAVNSSSINSGYYVYMLYLAVGNGLGAQNIVVTGGTGNSDMYVVAASYSGAAQTGVDGTQTFTQGLGLPFAVTWNTTADNAWQLAAAYDDNGAAMTAGANTVKRQANGFAGFALFDSNGPRTPAGSNSLNLNANSIGGGIAGAAYSIGPSSGGGGGSPPGNSTQFLMQTGVGT